MDENIGPWGSLLRYERALAELAASNLARSEQMAWLASESESRSRRFDQRHAVSADDQLTLRAMGISL